VPGKGVAEGADEASAACDELSSVVCAFPTSDVAGEEALLKGEATFKTLRDQENETCKNRMKKQTHKQEQE
jgi:hypothetical protein